MTRLFVTGLLTVALTSGCASLTPPIRLEGRNAEVQALAGIWSGEYVSEGLHPRRGSISFTLIEGEDHAHGDVLMIPEGFSRAYEKYHGQAPLPTGTTFPSPAETLSVRFVRVGDGVVSGVLEPYWDPDRECQASTTFRGRITARSIEGTFASIYSKPLPETTGRWKVTRPR